VVTKAGKTTHGLDRFFSSLDGKPVPGLAFFTLSLVSVQARRSFPLRVDQGVRSPAEKAASKAKAAAKKAKAPRALRRRGRPPGRPNQHNTHVTLTPELMRITAMMDALLHLIARIVPLTSLVLDGHFGNHHAFDGTAEQLAPHCQAAMPCSTLLSLYWALCWARPSAQIWRQGGV
jgi:putative transposase